MLAGRGARQRDARAGQPDRAGVCGPSTAPTIYRCRYGLNPEFRAALIAGPLRGIAEDENGELRAIELDGHPFFVATLWQPERAALEGQRVPLAEALVTRRAAPESRHGPLHTALIRWQVGEADFLGKRYSRAHTWTFDGGAVVPGVVVAARGAAADVGRQRRRPRGGLRRVRSRAATCCGSSTSRRAPAIAVDSYEDAAEGRMGRNARRQAGGGRRHAAPAHAFRRRARARRRRLAALHHGAHEECFLANSVRCEIRCEPVLE